MPTAAKGVGAILFFGIGYWAAILVLTTFPPEMAATYFPLTIGLIGTRATASGHPSGRGRARRCRSR